MSEQRQAIQEWIDQQRLNHESLEQALRLAGVYPGPVQWRQFFDRLLLWSGAVAIAAGVVFFFAYNWQALGRFFKFGLIELLLLAAVVAYCWLDGSKIAAKAALLVASIIAGTLLALVGQTYQTGADPWQLFAAWAALILPWIIVGQLSALWLFWLGLLNLAAVLYLQASGLQLLMFLDDFELQLWAVTVLNTVALVLFELGSAGGLRWLRGSRWPQRLLAFVSLSALTLLGVWAVIEWHAGGSAAIAGFALWLALGGWVYRYLLPDLFVLACGVFSAIVIITALLSRQLLDFADGGGFLFISLVVIGLSAAAGAWLRRLALVFAAEQARED